MNKNFLLFFLLISLSPALLANLSVAPAIVYFEDGKQREDILVKNNSTTPLYLQVTPNEIINPGSKTPIRKQVKNPKESSFLVTPLRLVLAPGQTKRVRMVRLDKGASDVERVFRIVFEPITGEIKASANAVKIIIAYEVLALVPPLKEKPLLSYIREGKKVTYTNEGNVNILLRGGYQCPKNFKDKEKDCLPINGKRLYPQQTWVQTLASDEPLIIQKVINQNAEEITIK